MISTISATSTLSSSYTRREMWISGNGWRVATVVSPQSSAVQALSPDRGRVCLIGRPAAVKAGTRRPPPHAIGAAQPVQLTNGCSQRRVPRHA
jgi:hypothetical protein